jgi:hypothetical protein
MGTSPSPRNPHYRLCSNHQCQKQTINQSFTFSEAYKKETDGDKTSTWYNRACIYQ